MRATPEGLTIGGVPVATRAREQGTPLYIYDAARIRTRVHTLRDTMISRGLRPRIYYAMKANRFRPVLDVLRAMPGVGIDASSPREVALALGAGFTRDDISFTASSLTTRDIATCATLGVHVNLDTFSAIRRYAPVAPAGTGIGLRVDTGHVVGYGMNAKTAYASGKLGLAVGAFGEALDIATSEGLIVDTLHAHLGWGLRVSDESAIREAFSIMADLSTRMPHVREINVGGGLGGRLKEGDAPLDVSCWADALAATFTNMDVTLACEPGTYLVADAGALVVEVASLWEKDGVHWAGVNAGHSVNVYAAHYDLPLEIIPVARPLAEAGHVYSIAGNVNESNDVFARDRPMPHLVEGELLALFPAGAYGSSMASDHCLRGDFIEVMA